jgi:hypothetical protein
VEESRDAGHAQLALHTIRVTEGSLEPGYEKTRLVCLRYQTARAPWDGAYCLTPPPRSPAAPGPRAPP